MNTSAPKPFMARAPELVLFEVRKAWKIEQENNCCDLWRQKFTWSIIHISAEVNLVEEETRIHDEIFFQDGVVFQLVDICSCINFVVAVAIEDLKWQAKRAQFHVIHLKVRRTRSSNTNLKAHSDAGPQVVLIRAILTNSICTHLNLSLPCMLKPRYEAREDHPKDPTRGLCDPWCTPAHWGLFHTLNAQLSVA